MFSKRSTAVTMCAIVSLLCFSPLVGAYSSAQGTEIYRVATGVETREIDEENGGVDLASSRLRRSGSMATQIMSFRTP